MSEEPQEPQEDPEHTAEVVPLRPGPDSVPAVPGDVPAEPEPRPAVYADITGQPGERRAIIPAALHRGNLRGTVSTFAGLQWHRSRYHGLRLLFYAGAAAVFAVVGAGRLAVQQVHWWWVLEQHELRSDAAAAGDAREWRALHKIARDTRKVRGGLLAAELAGLGIAVALVVKYAPWWGQAAAAAVGVPVLAWFGRPDGRRIISPAVVPPRYEPPTPGLITEALGSLGNANINKAIKDGAGIRFVSEVMRDGPGWGVQLDLPRGVTAAWIIAHRAELASGLRRPLSATWPEGVPAEHEGRLSLWVGFHDITRTKQPRWPLAKAGTADIFASVPFGTDPRMRPVAVPVFEVNYLIGASPGQGKTAALRALVSGAALDPVADLWVHEHAGKGDLEPFAQVCHRYCSGLDDDSIAYAADSARMLKAELERRSALFKKLPKEARPEGKITRELAVRFRQLRPIVAVFDEAQNVFMHPEHGEQAAKDLADVMRLGRAYGIIIILATQRPDKDSVPTAISGVVTGRFCLKVPDQMSNDMVLGTGAYKAGYNAAVFRLKTDAGLGWLKADGEPQVVRTYYLDEPATKRITDRARLLRERAGVLSGYAAGMEDEDRAAPRDVLADVLAVFGDGEPGQHWDVLAERLAERWPDRWADLSHTALSAQCRALGVQSVTVSVGGGKDKGCRKVAVEQSLGPAVSAQVREGDGNS